MFPSGKKNNTNRSVKRIETSHDSAVTILTSGCHFSGKLYCRGSTRIGGKIDGEIVSEGLLIIEEEAQINANVKADEAIIQGQVKGRLDAKGRVELCSTCSFEGDVVTPILVIQEGAQFNGRSQMIADPVPATEKPGAKATQKVQAESRQVGAAARSIEDVEIIKGPEISANV